MVLKDGIVTLYPYYSHLPTHNKVCTVSQRLAAHHILLNSHVNKAFWQQFQIYAPPSLRVIRFAKRSKCMTYVLWRILYITNLDLTDLRVSRSLANDYIHVCHSLGMWLFFLFQPQCLFQGKGGGGGGGGANSTCPNLRGSSTYRVKPHRL